MSLLRHVGGFGVESEGDQWGAAFRCTDNALPTETWPDAFHPVSPGEIGGNDDGAAALHAVLSCAARSCAAAAEAVRKRRHAAGSKVVAAGGADAAVAPATDRKKRNGREPPFADDAGEAFTPSPGVVVVSLPPRCGGEALVRLVALASGFFAAEEDALREASHIEELMQFFASSHSAEAKFEPAAGVACAGVPASATSPAASASVEAESAAREAAPLQPLLRLSLYDFWTLSKKQLARLLLRRREGSARVAPLSGDPSVVARSAAAQAASAACAPDVCLAVWREGDDALSVRKAAETLIEEALKDHGSKPGGMSGRVSAGAAPRQQQPLHRGKNTRNAPEDEACDNWRSLVAFVELARPPREAFVQRPLQQAVSVPTPPSAAAAASEEVTTRVPALPLLLPYEEPLKEETEAERALRWLQQDHLLQHFIIPPLERPLELPWGLAEAQLLPSWRLQRGDRRQQLQLFALRNSQAGDILAAPLHALDLLFWKLTPGAAKMLKWEEAGRGPLSDAGDEVCYAWGGAGDAKSEGAPGGGPPPSAVDAEALAAALSKCVPVCLSPVAASPCAAAACELVGELALGAVALLQHGDLPGAFESLNTSSTASLVLHRRRVRSLAQQQRQATRKRMQRAVEGPQRAVLLAQRLTAVGLQSLAERSGSQGPPPSREGGGSPEAVVQVLEDGEELSSEELSSDSSGRTVQNLQLVEAEVSEEAEAEAADVGALLERYVLPCGEAMPFSSVGTLLHAGEEVRLSLLERATERQQKATGRGRGSKGGGGNRGRGLPSLEPQAKLDSILSWLEGVTASSR
ncbi:hypothetical protein cyc_02003 [Cyclospora cayetanensis]|uniref:Uncharacterized protein n=1 Tax=Cyclospora cayetanensis TaxID=88456 RepID=A0A1D3CTZ2_9EIME|nr:hypothetical protein cyc_02003 [Cyclospora cayetanensis]